MSVHGVADERAELHVRERLLHSVPWNWAALRIWGKVEVFGSMGPRGLQNIAEIPWGLLVGQAVEHLGAALACAELGRGNSLSWPAERRRAGFSSCKCAFCFSIA